MDQVKRPFSPAARAACLAFAALLLTCCSSSSPVTDGGEDVPPDPVGEDAADAAWDPAPDMADGDGLEDLAGDEEGDADGADAADAAEDGPVELPDFCAPWEGLSGTDLVQALHAHLHDTYAPIEALDDEGGVPNRYTTARMYMFTQVEWVLVHDAAARDGIECVYTGTFTAVAEGVEPHHSILNCEHIWPRSLMDPDQESLLFSHQESDIHALYATLPEVNSSRGSFPFGVPVSDLATFVNPDDSSEFAVAGLDAGGARVFMPREARRGDVSRAMFYFSVRWGRGIEDTEETVLRAWYGDDPVDLREQDRNDMIQAIQGNRNPFVDCPALLDRIDDFAFFDILDGNDTLPPP
jgi:endonuclease I